MKTLLQILTPLIILVVIGTTIIYYRDGKLPLTGNTVTDTVYIDRPVEPVREYHVVEAPRTVYIYKTEPAGTVVITDTVIQVVTVVNKTVDTVYIDNLFLSSYPKASKLIQLTLDGKDMDLSLLKTNGTTVREHFRVDPVSYAYNYFDGKLTMKKRGISNRFHLYGEYRLRPLANFHDLTVLGTFDLSANIGVGLGMDLGLYKELTVQPLIGVSYKFF
jgi:hypothetical protein